MSGEVSIKSFFIYVLRYRLLIGIGLLCCTLLFSGVGFYTAYQDYSDTEAQQARQNKYAHDAKLYEKNLELTTQQVADLTDKCDYLENYMEQSIYYNLDYSNKAVTEIVLAVDAPSQNPNTTLLIPDTLPAIAFIRAYKDDAFYSRSNEILGNDYEHNYIDELISVSQVNDSNLIQLKISGSDTNLTDKLAQAVMEFSQKGLSPAYPNLQVDIISNSSYYTEDISLKDFQSSKRSDYQNTLNSLKSKEDELKSLQENKPEASQTSRYSLIKASVLYGCIGVLLYLILMCVLIFCLLTFTNKVLCINDFIERSSANVLGVIQQEKKKKNSLADKLITKMTYAVYTPQPLMEEAPLILNRLEMLEKSAGDIMVFSSVLDCHTLDILVQALNQGQRFHFVNGYHAVNQLSTAAQPEGAPSLLFVEQMRRSSYENIRIYLSQFKTAIEIKGFIFWEK